MKFLITGGAGYIGTNLANYLLLNNHQVVVLDNLELGNKSLVPQKAKLHINDLRNKKEVEKIFSESKIDAVFHLAAYSSVQESMKIPGKYFNNNIISTVNLLETMVKFNVKCLIFSSSAAVYGNPQKYSVNEECPLSPNNVYGQTKKIIEEMLDWYDRIYNIKFVSLRYFNAAGADYGVGEKRKNETHLIPLAIKTALKEKEYLTVFGNNYPTKDGTAIRDYVHITDISKAHLLSFNYLKKNEKSQIINLGSGLGKSVSEIVDLVKKINNSDFKIRIENRRSGDPIVLVANYFKAKKILGWEPERDIKEIIKSAYDWHKSQLQ
ncbi:MAG: UDP-glucose 4-epimerase GalE [Xanthomonadaceae bacterium]|nr:UDP-glucose 4-epimerase GalE [Rhodospirillaceae bacterium]NIA17631.1 UDP-glucose 4-epimerase GalE [Xanthomonadaceae bacterium]